MTASWAQLEDTLSRPGAAIIDCALAYAAAGAPVFPVRIWLPEGLSKTSKVPLTKHGLKDASVDPEALRRMFAHPRANGIGLRTGVVVDIIDVDSIDAVEAIEDYEIPFGPVAATSRGCHMFIQPTGYGLRTGMLPDVDYRGANGFAVVPPSYGGVYRWMTPPWEVDIPEASAKMLDLIRGTQRQPAPPIPIRQRLLSRAAGHSTSQWAQRALEAETNRVALAPKGQRNHELNTASLNLGQIVAGGGLTAEVVVDRLTSAAQRAGLGANEIEKTILSGMRAGFKEPRRRQA